MIFNITHPYIAGTLVTRRCAKMVESNRADRQRAERRRKVKLQWRLGAASIEHLFSRVRYGT